MLVWVATTVFDKSVSGTCRAAVRLRAHQALRTLFACGLPRPTFGGAGVNVGRANSAGSDCLMCARFLCPVRASCGAPPRRSEKDSATLTRWATEWNVLLWASWSKGEIDWFGGCWCHALIHGAATGSRVSLIGRRPKFCWELRVRSGTREAPSVGAKRRRLSEVVQDPWPAARAPHSGHQPYNWEEGERSSA